MEDWVGDGFWTYKEKFKLETLKLVIFNCVQFLGWVYFGGRQ